MMEMAENLDDPAAISLIPPPGILLSGHFKEKFGYGGFRPNGTRDWLITYTLSGEGIYYINQESLICGEGDFVILKPGTMHYYATREEFTWDFMWAHFMPPARWMDYFQLPEPLNGLLYYHMESPQTIRRSIQAFHKVMEDSQDMQPLWGELALHSLEEVFLLIQQNLRKSENSALDPRVEETMVILTQQMKEQHRVEDLAKTVNLSPSRLAHLFKKQTGDSILETLLKIRLSQAARLLEFTSRKISDIAHDVGFHDSFYFSRQFKAYYGMNPSSYKEQLQNIDRNP
jgi:AraC family transcriptional regulator of arabinose operon